MHILILEKGLSGHHAGYLERIARACLEKEHLVSVTVGAGQAGHPALARLRSRYAERIDVLPLAEGNPPAAPLSSLSTLQAELAARRLFGRAFRQRHKVRPVDYVFLPYLDYCLNALGLLGSPFGTVRWGGICMRPRFHYPKVGVIAPVESLAAVKEALFLRLLKGASLNAVHSIDELLCRYVLKVAGRSAARLHYLPDPAELKGTHSRDSARHLLEIPADAVVVLVYGAIDERKGLEALVRAAGEGCPVPFHLLIVGRQSAAVASQFDQLLSRNGLPRARAHVINEFVDDAVEQMAFAASDIVWLGYRAHYTMSGVLVLAAAAGKPVVATRAGLIGWYTETGKLGRAVDIDDVAAVREALVQVAEAASRDGVPRPPAAQFRNATWDYATAQIVSSIQSAAGGAEDPRP